MKSGSSSGGGWSSRSGKTWPRSGSAAIWISSTATKPTRRSSGMDSTVQTNQDGFGGTIFSSPVTRRSEEHTSELQSLMRISYAVFCLKKKHKTNPLLRYHPYYNRNNHHHTKSH